MANQFDILKKTQKVPEENLQSPYTINQNMLVPPNRSNTLQDLATLILMSKPQPQQTGPKMITAGGQVLGRDVSQPSGFTNAMSGLSGLASSFLVQQQLQKRNQFFKQVNDIMGANLPTDNTVDDTGKQVLGKKGELLKLITQNGGEDYGLGIKDVLVKELGINNQEYKPKNRLEYLENEQLKAGFKKGGDKALSPSMQKLKAQDTKELISTVEQNKISRTMIEDAIQSSKKVATGLTGKIRQGYSSNFNPNDPMLGEWQKIKMVLTDAQLMNTAKTKGAISDKEMELFSRAAANDDLSSIPKMMPVFRKLLNFIDANEKSLKNSYARNYDEDVEDLINKSQTNGDVLNNTQGNKQIPKYNPKTQKLQMNSKTGEYRVVAR